MKLSIITVVYNNERTITDAIESVLGQTYKNIEYIVVDGNSTDGTLERIEPYRGNIHHFVSERDNGIYDAMNKGLALATGDVIGILNSDDVYADPEILERIMSAFKQDPKLDLIYGDLVYVKPDNLSNIVRYWQSAPYYERFFADGHVPPHPSLFVKNKVYQRAGFFNITMQLAADYELMLRVFKKYDFKSKYIASVFVKMRLGGSTNKNWKNIIKGNKEILKAWKINNLSVPILLMPYRIIKRLAQFKK